MKTQSHRSSVLVPMSRRSFAAKLAGFAVVAAAGPTLLVRGAEPFRRQGRLKQAVCRGVFRGANLDLDGMCREVARLGGYGIDLLDAGDLPVLKKYGLICTMLRGGGSIKQGINDKNNHADIEPKLVGAIKAAADGGAPNVIVMAGDRKGITDEQGLETSAIFLNKIKPLAEDHGVTLCLELLNSKVNHPGYMADSTQWGAELCKRVNSPRVKLLYDIYHMQIMEGDVIRTIRDNIKYIGHFHTAGNPGRHEFDETQELYYPAICRAIADLKFDGYLAHEYTPTRDALGTLEKMMKLCDV